MNMLMKVHVLLIFSSTITVMEMKDKTGPFFTRKCCDFSTQSHFIF